MRIKIEDYFGNDIVELHIRNYDQQYKNIEEDIMETDEYNIADVDEDEHGIYVRVQLSTSMTMYKLNK
tara:strand:- start:3942 stop:4145 length:204 start_codon:yes stop_codon:yes gene_type:complete